MLQYAHTLRFVDNISKVFEVSFKQNFLKILKHKLEFLDHMTSNRTSNPFYLINNKVMHIIRKISKLTSKN